ncbi:MAG: oxidoreductase, partial [Deltaproteobacteria bacterium HGW-Deltaproteobacteria-14]
WRVPPVGVGLMRLSTAGRPDERAAVALVRRALDAGARLLDTADAYATGPGDLHHNEALIREALAAWDGPRVEVVVATKVGLTRPGGRWVPNGRPEHLRAAVDGCLRALGVERLDLLQLHAPDPAVPLAESLGTLAELARAGKARALGACNLRPADVDAALAAAPLVSLQARFNPFDKASWTNGLLATARDRGLTFIAHSPLGGHGGVGRVTRDAALADLAARLGATPFELALAWLLTLDPGLVVIPGATRPESVDSCARAAGLTLDGDTRRALAARFPWSRTATDPVGSPREKIEDHHAASQHIATVAGPPLAIVDVALDSVCATPRDEVVLLMGIPALGKTSAVSRFTAAGYVRLNRDRAGGKLDDLLPVLEAHHAAGARRFVLDNTYTLRRMRAGVIATAGRLGLPVRCVWMGGTVDDARYNAALRLFRKLGRLPSPDEIVARGKTDPNTFPPAVLDRFASTAEPVDALEGVERVERVPFTRLDPPDYTTRALLLGLDGTLRATRSGAPFPTAADDVVLLPNRREILAPLVAAGVRLFGVSNQGGVALGQVDVATVRAACDRTAALLGLPLESVWCPHPPGRATCWCRKPLPGLGVALIERWRLSRTDLAVVGDGPGDADFARALGVPFHDASDFFGA